MGRSRLLLLLLAADMLLFECSYDIDNRETIVSSIMQYANVMRHVFIPLFVDAERFEEVHRFQALCRPFSDLLRQDRKPFSFSIGRHSQQMM